MKCQDCGDEVDEVTDTFKATVSDMQMDVAYFPTPVPWDLLYDSS